MALKSPVKLIFKRTRSMCNVGVCVALMCAQTLISARWELPTLQLIMTIHPSHYPICLEWLVGIFIFIHGHVLNAIKEEGEYIRNGTNRERRRWRERGAFTWASTDSRQGLADTNVTPISFLISCFIYCLLFLYTHHLSSYAISPLSLYIYINIYMRYFCKRHSYFTMKDIYPIQLKFWCGSVGSIFKFFSGDGGD